MTMVPAENLSKQHRLPQGTGGFYGFNCGLMSSVHGYYYQNEANSMAEDEEGSSSKDNNDQEQEERDKSWLQLSIGTQTQATRTYDEYDRNKHEQGGPAFWRRGSALTELDLLPGGGSQSQQARPLSPIFHMPELRPPPPHHGALAPYFGRPFPVQSTDVAGPSSEVRIIDPPRRPHSGIWFMLQASRNQSKEPFLPQIPKSYLRIKDGKMTVRLIMKYLANKLRLDSESEIEIRCREQQLEPLWTLQHVRDKIWSSSSGQALGYTSMSHDNNNNVMLLHYARS
ncbi:hypothetical protein GQ457_15G003150 [Hibiscus cannabinus]